MIQILDFGLTHCESDINIFEKKKNEKKKSKWKMEKDRVEQPKTNVRIQSNVWPVRHESTVFALSNTVHSTHKHTRTHWTSMTRYDWIFIFACLMSERTRIKIRTFFRFACGSMVIDICVKVLHGRITHARYFCGGFFLGVCVCCFLILSTGYLYHCKCFKYQNTCWLKRKSDVQMVDRDRNRNRNTEGK